MSLKRHVNLDYGKYTTIVIGSDGKRYDLGKGDHLPWNEDETKRVYAVNAFTERIAPLDES